MDHDKADAPSTAAVGGHPIHPMLIPFPIAFLCAALVTDLASWGTGEGFWARGSFWLTLAGLITGVLAGIFGLIDFFTIRRARSLLAGWVHLVGNAVVLALAAASVLLRRDDPEALTSPAALTLSAVNAGLLVLTGWLGGELSYRHRIGVNSSSPMQSLPGVAQRRGG